MKTKTNQKLSPSRIIKNVIENTKEHLNETDKILHFNSSVLQGILDSPVFDLHESVKNGLKYVIDNNNKLKSSNALFKAVDVVVTVDEEDCN